MVRGASSYSPGPGQASTPLQGQDFQRQEYSWDPDHAMSNQVEVRCSSSNPDSQMMTAHGSSQRTDQSWDLVQHNEVAEYSVADARAGSFELSSPFDEVWNHEYTVPGHFSYDSQSGLCFRQAKHASASLPSIAILPQGECNIYYETSPTDPFHTHGLPGGLKEARTAQSDPTMLDPALPTLVGQPGYPTPRPPITPKARFKDEDDELLRLLKERTSASWKDIADFFPGRSSGTLQVRYCKNLKPKSELRWTCKDIEKLKRLDEEYEAKKWAEIARRLGANFTAEACQEMTNQLSQIPSQLLEEGESETGDAVEDSSRGES